MASARYTRSLSRWNVQWQSLVAYQDIEESRIKRRFGSEWRESQIEQVAVLNGYSTVQKSWYNGLKLTAGISGSLDAVQSEAFQVRAFPSDSLSPDEAMAQFASDTRYPNAGSSMGTGAVFATGIWNVNQHQLAGGLRWSRSRLDAAFEPTASFALPYENVNMKNGALTGGISDQWTSANREWIFQFIVSPRDSVTPTSTTWARCGKRPVLFWFQMTPCDRNIYTAWSNRCNGIGGANNI